MKANLIVLGDEPSQTDWLEILSIAHYEARTDAKLTCTNLESLFLQPMLE